MGTFDERTKIPVAWAISILISLGGVISTGAVSHYRLGALEESWRSFQGDQREQDEKNQVQQLKTQRLEDKLDSIERFMKRVDDRLERMENSGK